MLALWLAALFIALITLGVGLHNIERKERFQAMRDASDILGVQVESLAGVLSRFRSLPPILARQPGIQQLFLATSPLSRVRAKVAELAYFSGAADVALYRPDGEYIASARGLFAENLGAHADAANLLQAPYEARLGRATLIFDPGRRFYAFSALAGGVGAPLGVVVIFVDLEAVEQTWAISRLPILVSDSDNRVILSNVSEWLGRPVDEVMRRRADHIFFTHDNVEHSAEPVSRQLPLLQWRLHVLGVPQLQHGDRRVIVMFSVMLGLLIGLGGVILLRRRDQSRRDERKRRADALRLERLVARRTRDLNASNRSLQQEIEERKSTEQKLLMAQEEVVRSAKLAVIGQMSATFSHEYNQPLAAIGAYAENAATFLERGRSEPARENLVHIQQQVQRMAALTRTLLTFARREDSEIQPVSIKAAIDDALQLLSPRARRLGVAIECGHIAADWQVSGNPIRLSQVIVNLLNNAIDAVAAASDGRVIVSAAVAGEGYRICIADNGPGVAAELRDSIFDPFFTTKPAGGGLGIGLSVVADIVRQYGGVITVDASEGGGALFCVILKRFTANTPAA